MLARRRLLQLSVFDLFLATTAVVSLLVSYDLRAERAFVYTFGFAGGLMGTAIALNRKQPTWWLVLLLGSLIGVAGGFMGALIIEALHHGLSSMSTWRWHFEKGRRPATKLAIPFGLLGGALASILSTSLRVFRLCAKQERESYRSIDDQ